MICPGGVFFFVARKNFFCIVNYAKFAQHRYIILKKLLGLLLSLRYLCKCCCLEDEISLSYMHFSMLSDAFYN